MYLLDNLLVRVGYSVRLDAESAGGYRVQCQSLDGVLEREGLLSAGLPRHPVNVRHESVRHARHRLHHLLQLARAEVGAEPLPHVLPHVARDDVEGGLLVGPAGQLEGGGEAVEVLDEDVLADLGILGGYDGGHAVVAPVGLAEAGELAVPEVAGDLVYRVRLRSEHEERRIDGDAQFLQGTPIAREVYGQRDQSKQERRRHQKEKRHDCFWSNSDAWPGFQMQSAQPATGREQGRKADHWRVCGKRWVRWAITVTTLTGESEAL